MHKTVNDVREVSITCDAFRRYSTCARMHNSAGNNTFPVIGAPCLTSPITPRNAMLSPCRNYLINLQVLIS